MARQVSARRVFLFYTFPMAGAENVADNATTPPSGWVTEAIFPSDQCRCTAMLHPSKGKVKKTVFHRPDIALRIDRTEANKSKQAITSNFFSDVSRMNLC